jgi:hypothetical protein
LWTAGIMPLTMIALGVAFALIAGVDWLGLLLLGVIFGTPMVLRSWDRTVVSPAGVRVRRWFRWRALSWGQMARVAEPGGWRAIDVIAIITDQPCRDPGVAEVHRVTGSIPGNASGTSKPLEHAASVPRRIPAAKGHMPRTGKTHLPMSGSLSGEQETCCAGQREPVHRRVIQE